MLSWFLEILNRQDLSDSLLLSVALYSTEKEQRNPVEDSRPDGKMAPPSPQERLGVPLQLQHSVRFGDDFELDPRAHELRRAGTPLKLERIPLKILCLLLENPGQLISRDQIIATVWGSDVHLDTDNSINGAIRKLRQVLGDSCEQPRFISTVTGEGYRFIAPVQTSVEPPTAPPQHLLAATNHRKHPFSLRSTLAPALGLAVLLSALASIAYLSRPRFTATGASSSARTMIAVLPFENLTGDSSQEYFSDGLTEEMLTQLGNLDPQHLGVIARTSIMHYKGSSEPLEQIGRELGVQYVIEGSVRRDEGKVRVTAQLIQVKDRTHVWAREYDREQEGLLTVQGEIAQEIADEIQLTLGDRHPARTASRASSTSNSYEAYDLYLKGLYFWYKRGEALQQAASYFQQAVAKDPNYARAYAGLANTYGLMATWFGSQGEFMPKARAAAVRALQLDPSLAEGHAALALVAENYDYDWTTAEQEFRRAIDLDPNYATAHQWYGEYLSWMGRFDEALTESERARQLDPLSLAVTADHASVLYRARQFDRSLAECQVVLARDSNFADGWFFPVSVYVQQGRFPEALDFVNRYIRPHSLPRTEVSQAFIYGKWGRTAEARKAMTRFDDLVRHSPSRDEPVNWVLMYAALGQKDAAIAILQKAVSERSSVVSGLKVDPIYDPLRADPRFENLLHRLALDR